MDVLQSFVGKLIKMAEGAEEDQEIEQEVDQREEP